MWFEFNDNIVRPFNPEKLPEEAFGSDHHNEYTRSERRKNSYILIYDRSQLYNDRDIRIEKTLHPPAYRYCDKSLQEIKRENENISQRRILFSNGMLQFFSELLNHI
jgi:hypothetical protein